MSIKVISAFTSPDGSKLRLDTEQDLKTIPKNVIKACLMTSWLFADRRLGCPITHVDTWFEIDGYRPLEEHIHRLRAFTEENSDYLTRCKGRNACMKIAEDLICTAQLATKPVGSDCKAKDGFDLIAALVVKECNHDEA